MILLDRSEDGSLFMMDYKQEKKKQKMKRGIKQARN